MASLFFYGGVGEVGGNKILLSEKGYNFFLDFGTSFTRKSLFFEEFLQPRACVGLLDFLEMGLVPPLQGIYRPDLEIPFLWSRFSSHPSFRKLELQGILLSHAHLDHSGYISLLKEEIPIYASAMTAFISKAVQDSTKSDIEWEVCYLIPRQREGDIIEPIKYQREEGRAKQRSFKIIDEIRLSPKALAFWEEKPGARLLSPTPLQTAQKLGPFPLLSFPIDHSIPGASAFAVETNSGWIVYTGDIRFHGKKGELSWHFVNQVSQLKPLILITEGTYIHRQESIPEIIVLEKVLDAAKKTSGLIIADFAPKDIERLLTFHQVAKESERLLVILPRDAYLLETIYLLSPEALDICLDPIIRIYQEAKAVRDKWEREVLVKYKNKLVSASDVHKEQGRYILCFSFLDINELISIQPQKGSLYIYSLSEPHDEEGKLDLERLHNWLRHFEIKGLGLPQKQNGEWHIPEKEQGFHSSGHATAPDLLKMIQEINPKFLIPIHTEWKNYALFKEALSGTGIQLLIPEWGKEVKL